MNKKFLWGARLKEYELLNSAQGKVLHEYFQILLTTLISGWSRRGKTVLVMNPIHPSFVVSLWEAGFDVTVQEECPKLRSILNDTIGNRADILPDFPDSLGCEDYSYDYAIAMGSVAFWGQRKKVLEEIKRVVCSGAIFLFINKNSVTGLLRKKAMKKETLLSPLLLQQELYSVFKREKRQWKSMLLLPNSLETITYAKEKAREVLLPFPLGGVVGVRVNFGQRKLSTPLIIKQGVPNV